MKSDPEKIWNQILKKHQDAVEHSIEDEEIIQESGTKITDSDFESIQMPKIDFKKDNEFVVLHELRPVFKSLKMVR